MEFSKMILRIAYLLALFAITEARLMGTARVSLSGHSGRKFMPTEELQASSSELDLSEVGHKFAPYLYFHNLEDYGLADPQVFLNKAHLAKLDADGKVQTVLESITNDALLNLDTNCADSTCFLYNPSNFQTEDVVADGRDHSQSTGGAEYDSNGYSKAPVYFTAVEKTSNNQRYLVLSYLFWYEWNGCATMQLGGSLLSPSGMNVEWCPFGWHEGDWEGIQVIIKIDDQNNMKLSSAAFNQHSWTEYRDCEQGECEVEDETHIVGYPALNGHPTAFESSMKSKYSKLNAMP